MNADAVGGEIRVDDVLVGTPIVEVGPGTGCDDSRARLAQESCQPCANIWIAAAGEERRAQDLRQVSIEQLNFTASTFTPESIAIRSRAPFMTSAIVSGPGSTGPPFSGFPASSPPFPAISWSSG